MIIKPKDIFCSFGLYFLSLRSSFLFNPHHVTARTLTFHSPCPADAFVLQLKMPIALWPQIDFIG